ncbi:MAG: response regulator transcription factor [Treponema sp.]|jgi:DNA-binding NarL/FixJ family response regulator|nr:response regulator transcription factor [Treponema sp.]
MARSGNIKVLIVDNHPVFSLGLSTLLNSYHKFNVVGTTSNADEALTIAEKEEPKLAIVEIRLGKENGMDIISKLKDLNPEIVILALSIHDERFYSERLLRLGARGFLMKTSPPDDIMEAIFTILDGKVYLSENERERIFQAMTGGNMQGSKDGSLSIQKLSNRELQVFSLIGKGFGTIEIASRLNLSTKTIDTHKEHMKLKLHCASSQELRQQAIEWSNNNINT